MRRPALHAVATVGLLLVALAVLPAGTAAAQVADVPGAGTANGPAASATGPAATDAGTTAQATDPLVETMTYRLLPEEPDRVEVTVAYEVPDGVDELSFAVTPQRYEVVSTDGFVRTDEGRFEWTGEGDGGTVTLRHDVDESFRQEAPDERYVDGTGEWAIVARPPTHTDWAPGPEADDVEYRLAVDGQGRAGDRMAYLGPHTLHQVQGTDETITLVEPRAADLEDSPGEILDSVRHASERLRVGERSDEVTLIVAPTDGVDWTPQGLALGSDARVVDDARVDADVNVWVHEYVHTRQNRDNPEPGVAAVADDARWFVEGSADYYAVLLSLERGDVDFQTFRGVLQRGTTGSAADAVLAEPATWEGTEAHYEKGALVAGALDREIRAASGGEHTLQDVMREWRRLETFTADDLERVAGELGDDSTRESVETYTRTEATPEPWDRETHAELFEGDGPAFEYRTASDPPVEVTGPYRAGALPRPLVVGERIAADVRVENVGEVAGTYRARLTVGSEAVDAATGRLAPGESTTVRLEHTLSGADERVRLDVADHSRQLVVVEPAQPAVRRFTVATGAPVVGEPTAVEAEVYNPRSYPADGEVTLLVDGEPVDAESVSLAPEETATVELSHVFEAPGEHVVSMQGGEVTVEAREPTVVDRAEQRAQELPGFGAGAALVALVAAVALLARRG